VKIGAHVSIAGHISNAVANASEIGCEVFQIFTKNQNQWKEKIYTIEDISHFRNALDSSDIHENIICAHNSYLINLCAKNKWILRRSREAFVNEIFRCQSLGVKYLIFHPGAHLGQGENAGLNMIADSLSQVLELTNGSTVVLLMETTAGQGTALGWKFNHLALIIDKLQLKNRIGICLDTCHMFAAGYNIRDERYYKETFDQFEKIIGLDYLKAFHLNDSKKELGIRVDRHERIGKGLMGLKTFKFLMQDNRFVNIPGILEVPGGKKAFKEDIALLRNLQIV
jgi:deoxyribonuclease-4